MFPLHPETPAGGQTLEELFGPRVDLEAMHTRLRRFADQEGLPIGAPTHLYNTRLAQELAKWAETQPGGDAIHNALFSAYLVDGRDISDPDVLVETAARLGLPADEGRRIIVERAMKDAVDADWERSTRLGVSAVPAFVVDGMATVGAQPLDMLERFLESAGADRRTS